MSSSELTRLICWIFDGLEQVVVPWSMHFAGALFVGVRSISKKFRVPRFRPVHSRPRYYARRRLPSWAYRCLNWLKDFLIEALVIVGGSVVLALLCVVFFT